MHSANVECMPLGVLRQAGKHAASLALSIPFFVEQQLKIIVLKRRHVHAWQSAPALMLMS